MDKFHVAALLAKLIKAQIQIIEEDPDSAEFTIMVDKKKFTVSVRE